MRRQLNAQVAAGLDRSAVYQYFIDTYGSQEPLGAPIGTFNQLVWAVPLIMGGSLLAWILVVAVRWSRRGARSAAAPAAGLVDERLEARLDDELRSFD